MSTTSAAVGDAFGIAGIVNAGTARGPRIDAVTGGCYAVVDFVWLPDAIRAMARALKRCPLWTPGQMEARRTELELTVEPGVVMTDRLVTRGFGARAWFAAVVGEHPDGLALPVCCQRHCASRLPAIVTAAAEGACLLRTGVELLSRARSREQFGSECDDRVGPGIELRHA